MTLLIESSATKIPPKPIRNAKDSQEQPEHGFDTPNGKGHTGGYSPDELAGVELAPKYENLTREEKARFHFFRDEMQFVKDLTDISESLRLKY